MRAIIFAWKITIYLTLVALALAALTYFVRLSPSNVNDTIPRAAIIFTGQFDRVELGLKLFAQQKIDWLFISGVNPGAGMPVEKFADIFHLKPELRSAIKNGHIILSPYANNTLENAIEANRWVRRHWDLRAITLITSQQHGPRASLALERLLPRGLFIARIYPDASPINYESMIKSNEFIKFVFTWIILFVPSPIWTGSFMGGSVNT